MVLFEGRGGGDAAVAEFGFPGGTTTSMLESPLSMLGKLSYSTPTTSQGESFAERADRAERHLLVRDFKAARDIAMGALDSEDLGRDDFSEAGAIRLSFVLGQALFELGDLTDADKKLRRIYGSFTMIPDLVVVLWLTLLANHDKERETLTRFTDAFVKVNKKRGLGKIAGGTFLVSYIQLVLLAALDDPGRASSVLEALDTTGKEEKALKQKLQRCVDEYVKQREQQQIKMASEEAQLSEADREKNGREGEVDGEDQQHHQQSSSSTLGANQRPSSKYEEFVNKVKGLEKGELVAAGLVGSTFLYALYSERKSIRRAARKTWSKASGLVQSFGKYLMES